VRVERGDDRLGGEGRGSGSGCLSPRGDFGPSSIWSRWEVGGGASTRGLKGRWCRRRCRRQSPSPCA
jgi:hypothetical protein